MRAAAQVGDADAIRDRLSVLRLSLDDAGIELDPDTEQLATTLSATWPTHDTAGRGRRRSGRCPRSWMGARPGVHPQRATAAAMADRLPALRTSADHLPASQGLVAAIALPALPQPDRAPGRSCGDRDGELSGAARMDDQRQGWPRLRFCCSFSRVPQWRSSTRRCIGCRIG